MKKIIAALIFSAVVLSGCSDKDSSKNYSAAPAEKTTAGEIIAETTEVEYVNDHRLIFRMGTDPDGTMILTEENVISSKAVAVINDDGIMNHSVNLKFDQAGQDALAIATEKAAEKNSQISIWLDGEMISAPTVNYAITDGNALINGDFDSDKANELAEKIRDCVPEGKLENYEGEENE